MSEEGMPVEEVAEAEDVVESAVEENSPAPEQEVTQADAWGNFRSLPEFEGQDDAAIASRLYEAMQREQAATRITAIPASNAADSGISGR